MNRNIIETVMGAVVLLVAVLFLAFAYSSSSTGRVDGYQVIAKFGRVDGLASGSDVRLSGIKIGNVVDQRLDPQTFQAVVRLSIRDDIKLPADTAARILSDGLLGSNYLSLEPGGADEVIEPNGEITVTQDPVNIADLLGRFVFGSATPKEGEDGAAQP
ncbi:MAG TPA: outer membrane lipid asymmetry maintenance protein MlaD [Dongiaceae bacterium]|jgi:phospholipid/cholesterol/gamma-HCH transport system substrate-binding protein